MRIGYAADNWLIYGTGGLAYGEVAVSGSSNFGASLTAPGVILGTAPFAPATAGFGTSQTNVGFTLGGGLEGRLSQNWTWKLDYLYVDLGSVNTV